MTKNSATIFILHPLWQLTRVSLAETYALTNGELAFMIVKSLDLSPSHRTFLPWTQ